MLNFDFKNCEKNMLFNFFLCLDPEQVTDPDGAKKLDPE
jgi:hypothetical protein